MYKYTNPDVIRLRRNMYRLTIWSTVLGLVSQAAFLGWLTRWGKSKTTVDPTLDQE